MREEARLPGFEAFWPTPAALFSRLAGSRGEGKGVSGPTPGEKVGFLEL